MSALAENETRTRVGRRPPGWRIAAAVLATRRGLSSDKSDRYGLVGMQNPHRPPDRVMRLACR
jgi:hypothetical protein